MRTLIPRLTRCMRQNNSVNIYEDYFDREEAGQYSSEPPSAKGLAVFRDPSQITRTATSVNWHPEGSNNGRLAVSYAVLNFQDKRLADPNMPKSVRSWTVPVCRFIPPTLTEEADCTVHSLLIPSRATFGTSQTRTSPWSSSCLRRLYLA